MLLLKKVLSAAAMLISGIQYGMWLLSSLILLAAAIQLWRRGHASKLRIFFIYLVVVGLHGLINLTLCFSHPVWWFYSFFVGSFVTTMLGFAVLYEVAKSAVSVPDFKVNTSTFLTLCAIGAVLAVIVSINTTVTGTPFMRTRILLEVALRVMQVSILTIFAAVSVFFGLLWRRVEFGIVLGYGLYAASQLAVMYLRANGGSDTLYVLAPVVSFCWTAVIWLVYSSLRDPVVQKFELEPLLLEIQDSHDALERLR